MEAILGVLASVLVSLLKLIPDVKDNKAVQIALMLFLTLAGSLYYSIAILHIYKWQDLLLKFGEVWAAGLVFYLGLSKHLGEFTKK